MNTTKEMRRLQEQMVLRRTPDYLLPSERTWRAVWQGWRWRELLTALTAAGWLFSLWLWLHYGGLGEGGQGGSQGAGQEIVGVHPVKVEQGKGGAK